MATLTYIPTNSVGGFPSLKSLQIANAGESVKQMDSFNFFSNIRILFPFCPVVPTKIPAGNLVGMMKLDIFELFLI